MEMRSWMRKWLHLPLARSSVCTSARCRELQARVPQTLVVYCKQADALQVHNMSESTTQTWMNIAGTSSLTVSISDCHSIETAQTEEGLAMKSLNIAVLLAICVVVLFNFHILSSSSNATSESNDPLNSGLVPIINQLNGVPLQRRLTNVQENLAFIPRNIHLLDLKQSLVVPDFKCVLSQTDPSFPICVYPPEQDKFISGALLHSGVWEPYITKVFKKALQKHPNAVVLDVGANIGYYSFLAAKMGHMVVAIEPAEENVWRFHKGAQLGRLTDVIYLLQNAMSDKHQNITLITNKDNQGGIRVTEGADQGETIGTVTMDDLLYLMRPAEVIIKIDIEGYECKAMAKSAQLFQQVHVPYIFMEWQQMFKRRMSDTACPPYAMQQLTDMLTQRGYSAHEVRTGITMSPEESTIRWRVGDIYWRHQTQPLLFPPL